MTKKLIATINLQLPVAEDALGVWMEDNGAELSIQCMLGTYHVTVNWSSIVYSSDVSGTHRKTWSISRCDRKLPKATHDALTEAMRQTEMKKP